MSVRTFFDENKFTCRQQSDFQSLPSMVTYLLSNASDWCFHLDQEMSTSVVFVHLKKAFDTAGHILPEKLSQYGIKNNEHKLFSSYLRNKRQCCKVNGITSVVKDRSCGVPQGSYFGPHQFLLHFNDLPCALKCFTVTMYADHTSLAHSIVFDIHKHLKTEPKNFVLFKFYLVQCFHQQSCIQGGYNLELTAK